jgi:hypothetical protein
MTLNAFAVHALQEALRGLVIVGRGKFADAVDPSTQEIGGGEAA